MMEEFYRNDRGVRLIRSDGPKISRKAQKIARWGTLSYQSSLLLAAIWMAGTGAFAAVLFDRSGERVLTFVFVGCAPAVLTGLVGCLTCLVLKCASTVYDPFALMCMRASRILNHIGLMSWHYAVLPAVKIALRLFRIITDVLGRWATVVRSTLKFAELYLVIALVTCALAVGAVSYSISKIIRRRLARMAARRMEAWIKSVCMFVSLVGWIRPNCFAVWRAFVFGITFPVRLVAQVLIKVIPSTV
jgi:hypothetical protein